MERHIRVGEIDIPNDYFNLTETEKRELCENMVDIILTIIDKQIRPGYDKLRILDHLLTSSILTNELHENYEICQVLNDLRKLINE